MSERPIPDDVMAQANQIAEKDGLGPVGHVRLSIATGIMAERDRCKRLAYREKDKHGEDGTIASLEIALAILNGEQP